MWKKQKLYLKFFKILWLTFTHIEVSLSIWSTFSPDSSISSPAWVLWFPFLEAMSYVLFDQGKSLNNDSYFGKTRISKIVLNYIKHFPLKCPSWLKIFFSELRSILCNTNSEGSVIHTGGKNVSLNNLCPQCMLKVRCLVCLKFH